jgi:hypothetical protein
LGNATVDCVWPDWRGEAGIDAGVDAELAAPGVAVDAVVVAAVPVVGAAADAEDAIPERINRFRRSCGLRSKPGFTSRTT